MGSKTNPRRANGARRDRARAAVLARDDVCGICGQPVDKTLHYLDPGAPEVDEIVPVSLGGSPFELTNLRLTHLLCNRRRGNGLKRSVAATERLRRSQDW